MRLLVEFNFGLLNDCFKTFNRLDNFNLLRLLLKIVQPHDSTRQIVEKVQMKYNKMKKKDGHSLLLL